jgi:hypothetical protein
MSDVLLTSTPVKMNKQQKFGHLFVGFIGATILYSVMLSQVRASPRGSFSTLDGPGAVYTLGLRLLAQAISRPVIRARAGHLHCVSLPPQLAECSNPTQYH